jgi:cytochrome oxidase Cu insertion factor (SCO1/SenC/PrrC family)
MPISIPVTAAVHAAPAHAAPFRLSAYAGRTIAVSFVTQASSSICNDVSGKFAYLQHHLDPRREHLVTVMLDPAARSDAAVARYAANLSANDVRWTFAHPSSESAELEPWLQIALNASPVTQHAEQIAIIDASGRLVDVIDAHADDPAAIQQAIDDVAYGRRVERLRHDDLQLIAKCAFWLVLLVGALFGISFLPERRRKKVTSP